MTEGIDKGRLEETELRAMRERAELGLPGRPLNLGADTLALLDEVARLEAALAEAHSDGYVESLRKRTDEKQAAWEHQVLVRADLERKVARLEVDNSRLRVALRDIAAASDEVECECFERNGNVARRALSPAAPPAGKTCARCNGYGFTHEMIGRATRGPCDDPACKANREPCGCAAQPAGEKDGA